MCPRSSTSPSRTQSTSPSSGPSRRWPRASSTPWPTPASAPSAPASAAAELEASKVFCKNLLRHADVPTADFRIFRDAASASAYLTEREDVPVVVKADGLAAGKGVIVCDNREQALEAVERIAGDREFGAAGRQLVIEERLVGQEASVLALVDGRTILTLPAAQDHKPAFDGDHGPNTGGMGAYCPRRSSPTSCCARSKSACSCPPSIR